MAWRNIWRSRARTAITGAAIAINAAVLIVSIGLTQGMYETTIGNLTGMALGEAQVHARHYREDRSLYETIAHPDAILKAAEAAHIDAAERAYGTGLASVGSKSSGAVFWGIDPARERAAFELADHVQQGEFLTPAPANADDGPHPAVLGRKLANILQAEVGSELVAVVQAADGSIGNDLYRVTGILQSVSSDVDASAVILRNTDFQDLFLTGGKVHEVALTSHGRLPAKAVADAVRDAAAPDEVMTWRELAPGPAQMLGLYAEIMVIFGLVFGLAAGSSVMNAMLMSTYDRMREFGVEKALGATPGRIIRDVGCEALLMGLVFGGIGAVIGAVGNAYLSVWGIDLGTENNLMMSGVAFDPVWRSTQSVAAVLGSAGFIVGVSVLASIYPAIRAARLDPVIAMTEPS